MQETCCRHERKKDRVSPNVLDGLTGASIVARPSTRAMGSDGRCD